MLKLSVTADEYAKLPEAVQSLYNQDGDNYALETPEGMISEADSKERIKEFRDNNIELMKERDKLKKSVLSEEEIAEFRKLKTERENAEREALKDEDKFEAWIAKHEESWDSEREGFKERLAAKDRELERYKLDDKVRAAALDAGVSKDSIEDVITLTRAKKNFRLTDDDEIKVYDDDGAPVGGTPKKFFDGAFKKSKPFYYDGTGSGGSGTDQVDHQSDKGGGGSSDESEVKILGSDQDSLNMNLEDIAAGTAQRGASA